MRMSVLLAALGSLALSSAAAQSSDGASRWADSARTEIEIANRLGDADRLTAIAAVLERALTAHPGEPLLAHYRAYAQFREATIHDGRGEKDRARELFDAADRGLDSAAKGLPLAETHALRASVLGQLIGDNPLRAMRLGPQSSREMERALELGPNNPRVWLLHGVGAIFTPAMFGGGLDKARERLERAIELFATDRPRAPLPAWGHAEAHAWLGQVHHRGGRIEEARHAYRRALEIEPDYTWVRDQLLPALDRASR